MNLQKYMMLIFLAPKPQLKSLLRLIFSVINTFIFQAEINLVLSL